MPRMVHGRFIFGPVQDTVFTVPQHANSSGGYTVLKHDDFTSRRGQGIFGRDYSRGGTRVVVHIVHASTGPST